MVEDGASAWSCWVGSCSGEGGLYISEDCVERSVIVASSRSMGAMGAALGERSRGVSMSMFGDGRDEGTI